MRRCGLTLISMTMCILLGACVQHRFVPGPGKSAMDFEPDSAKCRIFARGANPGHYFAAYGSTQFVATSTAGDALGGAIGDAMRQNANYNDCMEAAGWRVADGPTPVVMAPYPLSATNAAAQPSQDSSGSPFPVRRDFGIRVGPMNAEQAAVSNLDSPRGLLVLEVVPGSAGAEAHLQPGDVILNFAGTPIMDVADIQRELASVKAGSMVATTVWRRNHEQIVTVQF